MRYKPTIFFVVTLLLLLTGFAVAVVATAAEHGRGHTETPSSKMANRVSRPALCAPYYNDGTDRWKDCMGVGYR